MVSWVADDPVDVYRLPVELSAGLAGAKDCAVPKLFTREVREGQFFTVVNDEYPVLVGHWRYVFRTKSEGHQPVAAGTVALG
jgi:hypothetical protein